MKKMIAEQRYLVCGYGFPADYVVNFLFSNGVFPTNIALMTHSSDARNVGLISAANLRGVAVSQVAAKSDEAYQFASKFCPDLIVSMHYRELIPARILRLAKIGSFNLHPSLLPDYRGANSIPWSLINGEKEIGFTYHYMNDRFDEGNIIYQDKFPVLRCDTAFSLFHKSMLLSLKKFSDVIDLVLSGYRGIKQPSGGSYYSRELPFGGEIDTKWTDDQILRFIKAMYFPPFDGAFVNHAGQKYFINTLEEFFRIKTLTLRK